MIHINSLYGKRILLAYEQYVNYVENHSANLTEYEF